MSRSFLILGASEEEIAPLKSLTEKLPNVTLGVTGVGLVEAASRTSLLVSAFKTKEAPVVLFIGSAGAANEEVPLLSLVECTRAKLDTSLQSEGESYLPSIVETDIATTFSASSEMQLADVTHGDFYCPLSICRSRELGEKRARMNRADFENLEVFAVALVCKENAIPWGAISVVTNHLNERSHEDWVENSRKAAELTASFVAKLL